MVINKERSVIEKMLQTLLGELQKISRAETVIGEPIVSGGATIVPISRVHIGFAAGTSGNGAGESPDGKGKFSGTGSGGGIRVEPVACIVVNKEGHAQLLQLTENSLSTVGKAIDLLPEVMDRLGLTKGEGSLSKKESKE